MKPKQGPLTTIVHQGICAVNTKSIHRDFFLNQRIACIFFLKKKMKLQNYRTQFLALEKCSIQLTVYHILTAAKTQLLQ